MRSTFHIQEVCKLAVIAFFCVISLQSCGSGRQPPVQNITFDASSVPYQNTSCSTGFTLINNSTVDYALAFLTATFKDENEETFTLQKNQEEVIETFDATVIPSFGNIHAEVTFDLQNANLTPPLIGTVIVVGISGSQVTHFVGDFRCE